MFCNRAGVEVFLRYSPQVRVLEDPHYSLDAVHRDALLETAETCRRTRREAKTHCSTSNRTSSESQFTRLCTEEEEEEKQVVVVEEEEEEEEEKQVVVVEEEEEEEEAAVVRPVSLRHRGASLIRLSSPQQTDVKRLVRSLVRLTFTRLLSSLLIISK